LTRELGKIEVTAKGARKPSSRFAAISEPLAMARYSFAPGKVKRYLTSAEPMASFRGLRTDFDRLNLGVCLAELLSAVVPEEQEFPEVFDFAIHAFEALSSHTKPRVAAVWCHVRLLQLAGFLPSFDRTVDTGEPILGTPVVSPTAGGLVSAAHSIGYSDRFEAFPEVLWGLARIVDLDEPPSNLKFAEQSLLVLFPFWRNVSEGQLPANESYAKELRHGLMSGT
jgi:DNA repair protein RecO (recombination protein O)